MGDKVEEMVARDLYYYYETITAHIYTQEYAADWRNNGKVCGSERIELIEVVHNTPSSLSQCTSSVCLAQVNPVIVCLRVKCI